METPVVTTPASHPTGRPLDRRDRPAPGGTSTLPLADAWPPDPERGESLLWSVWAQRGDEDTRPTAGHFFVTTRRMAFRPTAIERFTGEQSWECPIEYAKVLIRPGDFVTNAPIVRSIALRGRITVTCPDQEPENFWVLHPEEWLSEQMKDLPINIEAP